MGSRSHFQHLTICFTDEGETADDYIIDELKASKTPRQIIVVTSDKNLAWRARQFQSKTQTVEEFGHILYSQYKNKLKDKPKNKPIPPKIVPVITPVVNKDEETFNYYLREFEKRFLEEVKKNPILNEPMSDSLRWLDIFEKRFKDLEQNQKDV